MKYLRIFLAKVYDRPDSEYYMGLFTILGIGLSLLVVYSAVDYMLSLHQQTYETHFWVLSRGRGHFGHLMVKYPLIAIFFKVCAFFSLPLALFYGKQWKKARRISFKRDDALHRIEDLTAALGKRDAELRRERNRFKQVVEMQMEFVCKVEPDGTITFVNKALYTLLGFKTFKKLIGKNLFHYMEDEKETVAKTTIAGLTRANPRMGLVLPVYDVAEKPVYIEWRGCGVFKGDKLHKVLMVGRNITEKVELKASLHYTEGQYRRLFKHMLSGFAIHQVVCNIKNEACDYRFLEVNEAFLNMFGFQREMVTGNSVLDIMPNTEPNIIKRFGQVANTGTPDNFVCHFVDVNKWFQITAFQHEPGQFAATYLDVSDRLDRSGKLERATD